MSDHIDYYLSIVSPFAYMGHKVFFEMAAKHGKTVNIKIFNMAEIFGNSGASPVPQRPPVRQRYRLLELQRISELRGVKLNTMPTHFPINAIRADLCACALINQGKDAKSFLFAVPEAFWANDLDISDEAVLSELLEACGHDAAATLTASHEDANAELRYTSVGETDDYAPNDDRDDTYALIGRAHYFRGLAHLQAGALEDAIRDLGQAELRSYFFKNRLDVRFALGRTYLLSGRPASWSAISFPASCRLNMA